MDQSLQLALEDLSKIKSQLQWDPKSEKKLDDDLQLPSREGSHLRTTRGTSHPSLPCSLCGESPDLKERLQRTEKILQKFHAEHVQLQKQVFELSRENKSLKVRLTERESELNWHRRNNTKQKSLFMSDNNLVDALHRELSRLESENCRLYVEQCTTNATR